MSLIDIIMSMPWWYLLILVIFSVYYAVRGIMEQMIHHAQAPYPSKTQRLVILYIQEFLFKVIITASGFLALFIANTIFADLRSYRDMGVGTAVFIMFLLVWGVTGISGYLTFLIVKGKWPTLK